MTAILGTGYQYGDTDFIEYSERIYTEFSKQLRYGTGAVAIGNALLAAKLAYLKQTPASATSTRRRCSSPRCTACRCSA